MTPTAPTAVPAAKTVSPHTQPAVATAIGVAIGVLTLIQGYFGSGHIPDAVEVASVLAGAGISLGSVGAYIYHHAAWLKTVGPEVAAAFPAVEHAVEAVPALAGRVAAVEHAVQEQAAKVIPGVDVAAVADQVKQLIVGDAVKQPVAGAGIAAPVVEAQEPGTPATT